MGEGGDEVQYQIGLTPRLGTRPQLAALPCDRHPGFIASPNLVDMGQQMHALQPDTADIQYLKGRKQSGIDGFSTLNQMVENVPV